MQMYCGYLLESNALEQSDDRGVVIVRFLSGVHRIWRRGVPLLVGPAGATLATLESYAIHSLAVQSLGTDPEGSGVTPGGRFWEGIVQEAVACVVLEANA
jgi:hypothetical protein